MKNSVFHTVGTIAFFRTTAHLFRVVARKAGVKAGPNSTANCDIADRVATTTLILNIYSEEPPQISITYAITDIGASTNYNTLFQISNRRILVLLQIFLLLSTFFFLKHIPNNNNIIFKM